MIRRIPFVPVIPAGWGVVAALGAATVVLEHQQGKHQRASAVCALCWLNRLAPAAPPPGPTQSAATSAPADTAEPPADPGAQPA